MPSRTIVTVSGLVESQLVELRASEAGRRLQLEIATRQVGRDALLVLVQGIGARRVRIPERDRFRDPPRGELCGVRGVRLPRPVRRLVMDHQEERLVARPLLMKSMARSVITSVT